MPRHPRRRRISSATSSSRKPSTRSGPKSPSAATCPQATSAGPKNMPSDPVRREIGVGLIGLGVVGGGVARALLERSDYFARQVGAAITVRRAAVRDLSKPRTVDLPPGMLTTNVDDVINDP